MKARLARSEDLRRIVAIDPLAASRRKALVRDAITARGVHVLEEGGELIAYAILRRGFFERFFLELLLVDPGRRREGWGGCMLERVEDIARTGGELWASTNQSNRPMRRLLKARGFHRTGKIVGLDEGDPELFFVKRLAPKS